MWTFRYLCREDVSFEYKILNKIPEVKRTSIKINSDGERYFTKLS